MAPILPDRLGVVLIASFPTGPWQANCYLISPRNQADDASTPAPAVVVDPGVGAADQLSALLAETGLVPTAVLLTHGHIDHVAGAQSFADVHQIPVHLHPADEHLLSDPAAGIGAQGRDWLATHLPNGLRPPADLHELIDGQRLTLADLEFEVLHAPGHTAGCALLRLPETDHGPVVFTGDVIFAGSIGRTDLPGSDPAAMQSSLREVVWALDDGSHLLPGHGQITTMAAERASNPYLSTILTDTSEEV